MITHVWYVCPSIFLTTTNPIEFTLGGCIAEDPRKCGVECGVVWVSNSQESCHQQQYQRPRNCPVSNRHMTAVYNDRHAESKQGYAWFSYEIRRTLLIPDVREMWVSMLCMRRSVFYALIWITKRLRIIEKQHMLGLKCNTHTHTHARTHLVFVKEVWAEGPGRVPHHLVDVATVT